MMTAAQQATSFAVAFCDMIPAPAAFVGIAAPVSVDLFRPLVRPALPAPDLDTYEFDNWRTEFPRGE